MTTGDILPMKLRPLTPNVVCTHGYACTTDGYSSCVFCAPHKPACKCNSPAPCLLVGPPHVAIETLESLRGGD